jgi:CubicO group peptidase (beta-lactamase class C family)
VARRCQTPDIEVQGSVDERFAPVREAFQASFDRGEVGASCHVLLHGEPVVDLWGGWADQGQTRPWQADTLVNSYSVGKPLAALQLLQLVASGDVELDAPAERWWPEMLAAQQGATVRHLLSHQAGVPAIRAPMRNDSLRRWDEMATAVAETEPWWQPGTRHAYHCNTYGFVVGEVARRITGEQPGEWIRRALGEPLGADVFWGVPDAELHRCADVQWLAPLGGDGLDWDAVRAMSADDQMVALGYFNPLGFSSVGVVNETWWRQTQVPSTNLHATARGVARVYAGLDQVLPAEVLAEATSVQSEGWCPFLQRQVSFGLGFQPTRPERPFGPNPGSFGHYGSGGALGFADPSTGLAFGYVMNAVKPGWQNERNQALVEAAYASL